METKDTEKAVDAALARLAEDPVSSESISTPNGGSRSVTNLSPESLIAIEKHLATKKRARRGWGISYLRYG